MLVRARSHHVSLFSLSISHLPFIGQESFLEEIQFADALRKTRSGKIMRRILKRIAAGRIDDIGDTTTLADPTVVETLIKEHLQLQFKERARKGLSILSYHKLSPKSSCY